AAQRRLLAQASLGGPAAALLEAQRTLARPLGARAVGVQALDAARAQRDHDPQHDDAGDDGERERDGGAVEANAPAEQREPAGRDRNENGRGEEAAGGEAGGAGRGPQAGETLAGTQQLDAGGEREERNGSGEGDATRGRRAERQPAVCGSDQRLESQRGDGAGEEVDEPGERAAAREPERERERQDAAGGEACGPAGQAVRIRGGAPDRRLPAGEQGEGEGGPGGGGGA